MAYEYAISFDIKADATYSDRYTSLMNEIRKTPGDPSIWSETTSFVLLESDEKIDALESRLYTKSKFDSTRDKIVVVDHLNSVAVARGPIQYPATLKSHFKSCVIK